MTEKLTKKLAYEARAKATRDALSNAGMEGELFMRQPIKNKTAAMTRELLPHRHDTPADDLRAALEWIAADIPRPEKGLTSFGECEHYRRIALLLRDMARAALAQKGDA